jgi:hypothetical protein
MVKIQFFKASKAIKEGGKHKAIYVKLVTKPFRKTEDFEILFGFPRMNTPIK